MKTGCSMIILSNIPHRNQILKIVDDLSEVAKFRLQVIDWYRLESPKYSKINKPSVALTCRHFGIHRSMFYRWLHKFDSKNIKSLDNKSHKPKNNRKCVYTEKHIEMIKTIRTNHPTYSKVTVKAILNRDYQQLNDISISTIGRIINKYNLYFAPKIIKERKKLSKAQKKAKERKRLPYFMRATKPNEIIEFDMKHINVMGKKYYAMCAIDQFTRRAMIHITGTPSSIQATIALQKAIKKFGKDICIVNDNGSENMGKAEEWLKENKIEQFWARPHKPKDKPYIERFIGTYQRECLDFNYEADTQKELQEISDKWIKEYENYRPHRGLKMLTPIAFENKIKEGQKLYDKVSYII